jgi:pimeloyl-ACP methyl ester carboxylesterase
MMQRLLAVLVAAIALGVVELALWLHRAHDWHPALAMLGAATVPVLADAAILGKQFTIGAWLRRRTRPDLRPGLAAALRAWLGEIVASLRTFFYAQIRYGARPLPSGAGYDRVPVLLVHGYFCNRGIWHPFARWLAERGHAVDSVNLEPVFGPIDDYVPLVEAAVERLRVRTGAERVAVVAHSMGGLAVRAFLAQHGSGAIDAVVTLGTPHRGTWLARFGYGRNVSQMRLDSGWLRELAAREAGQPRAPFTVILSHHDNIVAPQSIQTLQGARTIELTARGHVELAYDRGVWARALEAIETSGRG